MYTDKLTTVALALLLSAGTLAADPSHSGRKESAGMKQSTGYKQTRRSDQSLKHVSKPSRDVKPKVRTNIEKTPHKVRQTVQEKAVLQHQQLPVTKTIQRTPAWTPPKRRPRPYYHRPGYTIGTLPKAAVTVSLGSLLFYYSDGIYYSRHNNGFIVMLPPVGLIVPVLPVGYIPFYLHGLTYYYYADVYYVWDVHHRAYRVVEAPQNGEAYQPGTILDTLPDGAYTVTINGVQYYRYGEVYFLQSIQGERIVYIVVIP